MKKILSRENKVLGLFLLIAFVFYYPAYKTGIVNDFPGWILKYEAGNFGDILHCFGYNGHHQVFHFFNYLLFRVAGVNPWIWSAVFVVLHALISFQWYVIVGRIESQLSNNKNVVLPLLVALFFLLSPYQFEVLTWKACLHYLMVTQLFLIIFSQQIKLINKSSHSSYILFLGSYLAALFVLELAMIFPFICLSYLIIYNVRTGRKVGKQFFTLILPLFGMLIAYFLLNKLTLGEWVGHYGPERHFNVDWFRLFAHPVKYFLKYLTLASFNPFQLKSTIYLIAENAAYLSMAVAVLLAIAVWMLTKLKSGSRNSSALLFSFISFFLAVAPVITLFFYKDMYNENDRYSYFASLFFYWFILNLVFRLPDLPRFIALILLIAFHSYYSLQNRSYAIEAGESFYALLENYPSEEEAETYILTMPDNYAGFFLFRDYVDYGLTFKEASELLLEKEIETELTVISQYNMMSQNDRFHVEWVDENTIKVAIGQDGTWFWRRGIGATDYVRDDYKVEFKGWYYLLHILNPNQERVYLYQDGLEWKQLEPYTSN